MPESANKSTSIIKVSSGFHLMISCSIIIFGIGVPPIWQGLVGVITALEGYYGIQTKDLKRVTVFIWGLFVNAIVGVTLGLLALSEQTQTECKNTISGVAVRKEQNFTFTYDGIVRDCASSYQMYAYVEFGTAVISAFILTLVSGSYFTVNRTVRRTEDLGEVFLIPSS